MYIHYEMLLHLVNVGDCPTPKYEATNRMLPDTF
jgi:hypothetical protein